MREAGYRGTETGKGPHCVHSPQLLRSNTVSDTGSLTGFLGGEKANLQITAGAGRHVTRQQVTGMGLSMPFPKWNHFFQR
jgi:hypothetical protein